MNTHTHEKLGNYRLIQRLGTGSFSTVYLGEHFYLKTPAAVKVLHSRFFSDEALADFLADFLKEARIIARLDHPHIVRVLDFGVEEHMPYLVLQYAPNGTVLQRYPKRSRLPLPIIVQYVRQIAEALQYAHELGIIHRDVKPENFLLSKDDEILLGDFGLAIRSQSLSGLRDQEIAGTAEYMAPEQLQGQSSRASDQYALGIVVYEWLCGYPPFRGADYALLHQHMYDPPTLLHELVPGMPKAVEEVVMRALAKEPSERFPQIQDFAHALEAAYHQSMTQLAGVAEQGANVPSSALEQSSSKQEALDAPSQDHPQPQSPDKQAVVDPSKQQTKEFAAIPPAKQKQRMSRRTLVAAGILGLAAIGGCGATTWYLLNASPHSRATVADITTPLTLRIGNAGALTAVRAYSTNNIVVTTSLPGIPATVQVTYSNGNVQTLGPQTTNGSGNATFSWRAHPNGGLGDVPHLSAILVASATGASGQIVVSALVRVKITLLGDD